MKDFTDALKDCVNFLDCKAKLTPAQLAEDVLAMAALLPGAGTPIAPPWCGGTIPAGAARALADAQGHLIAHEGTTKPQWTADGGAPTWVLGVIETVLQAMFPGIAPPPLPVVQTGKSFVAAPVMEPEPTPLPRRRR